MSLAVARGPTNFIFPPLLPSYNILIVDPGMEQIVDTNRLISLFSEYGTGPDFQAFLKGCGFLNRFKYANITRKDIVSICKTINKQKISREVDSGEIGPCAWKKCEYRLFLWVCVYYSYNCGISIKQFRDKDFQFLGTIFVKRNALRMSYQLNCILNSKKSDKRSWTHRQKTSLKKMSQRYARQGKRIKWKCISYDLFVQSSGQIFRTYSQCRQMWENHLNTKIKKQKWTQQEDDMLLQQANLTNNCWSKIVKKFQGTRSAHMIKNRYHFLMKRRMNKESDQNNMSNEQLRESKTRCQSGQFETGIHKITNQFKTALQQSYQLPLPGSNISSNNVKKELLQNKNILNFTQSSIDGKNAYSLELLSELVKIDDGTIRSYLNLSILKEEIAEQLGCAHFQLIQNELQQQQVEDSLFLDPFDNYSV